MTKTIENMSCRTDLASIHQILNPGADHLLEMAHGEELEAVLQHLATGCLECAGAIELLRARVGSRPISNTTAPPEQAVEAVMETFAMGKLRKGNASAWASGCSDVWGGASAKGSSMK